MSKGDDYRPVDKPRYDANFDRIFGEHILPNWQGDKDDLLCTPHDGVLSGDGSRSGSDTGNAIPNTEEGGPK